MEIKCKLLVIWQYLSVTVRSVDNPAMPHIFSWSTTVTLLSPFDPTLSFRLFLLSVVFSQKPKEHLGAVLLRPKGCSSPDWPPLLPGEKRCESKNKHCIVSSTLLCGRVILNSPLIEIYCVVSGSSTAGGAPPTVKYVLCSVRVIL